jgi:ribonucleoside-diphosphate reductase alpha chain
MKLINNSIKAALTNLGYTSAQIEDIIIYITGNNTFDGAPFINRASLVTAGIHENDIDRLEDGLDSACQLVDVLNFKSLSSESVNDIGLSPSDASVNIYKQMNFTKEQYAEASKWICGHGTLEGAPHIKREHLPIFQCAVPSGYGKTFLRWQAHVRMVSAVSPFISGGISKTVNMPNDATKKDIAAAYMMAYDGRSSAEYCPGGIKCLSVYRDGSKKMQPLINPYGLSWWDPSPSMEYYPRSRRRKPPKDRSLRLHEVTINSPGGVKQKLVVKFGEYEDGSLCEVWIEVTKDNPSFYFASKWAARAISNAIQYGMPLEDIAASFINEEGGPFGRTDHKYITNCKSIIDLVVKLAMLYYRGDVTWTRRKPPIHELRVTKLSDGTDDNEEIELGQKTADKLIVIDNSCPVCGSTDIQYFPCTTCNGCGAPLGGCSP